MEDLKEAVCRMQQGDQDAFDQIFTFYQNRLLRTAWLILGNRADCEDVVQDTFVTCYCSCHKLRDPAMFSTWILQILTRKAWRCGKKHHRETPVEDFFDSKGQWETENMPLEQVLKAEMREELYRGIMELNQKQRTVIILYYFNQLSTKEISRIMGCFEGTVKSRLFAARKSLEQHLRKERQYGETENRCSD